jgi:hypothetical protein
MDTESTYSLLARHVLEHGLNAYRIRNARWRVYPAVSVSGSSGGEDGVARRSESGTQVLQLCQVQRRRLWILCASTKVSGPACYLLT